MMIDYNTRLTPTAQAVTTTAVTTDKYPLTSAGRDIGVGEQMGLLFTVTVAALVAGTESYILQVVTATASDGTTGQRILNGIAFTTAQAASLVAGSKWFVPIPPGVIPATATHLCGRFETANSAGITCLVDLVPAAGLEHQIKYAARPTYPTGA